MSLEIDIETTLDGFTLRVAFAVGRKPVGLLGSSGAGKTLTLRAIAGLDKPTRGRISLGGRALFDSSQRIDVPSRERGVSMLFQNFALFPHLTVEQNVGFGIRGMKPEKRAERIAARLAATHLIGYERRYPGTLSGGQQQRVALARALAPGPAALLLDEPFSALDTHLRSQLERELQGLLSCYEGVALLVSHNLEELYRLCPELVVLDRGAVVAHGSTPEIFRKPPNRQTAELTGCKNFSRARPAGDFLVEALDWGCTLRVSEKVPPTLGHIAVRAHHIRVMPSPPLPQDNLENAITCWIMAVTHGPFRVTLYLRLGDSTGDAAEYRLQAEMTREEWDRIANRADSLPCSIVLEPDSLMLLPA